jgi:hypothetical protein
LLDLGLGRSIYSTEQVEEFLWCQDSKGTKKAYLAETEVMAYSSWTEDGTWGLWMEERAKAAIIDTMGLSFIPLYRIVGPLAISILFLMFIWGLVRLVVTVIMQAIAIYRTRGAGLWMLGAFWSLPFQLIIMPFRWVGGTPADVADWVGTEMECQAHHEEARRGGSYPAAALEELERGRR